nr:ORF1 [Torque teno midi virus]
MNISSEDFYQATPFNQVTKQQIWMSQIADGHDNICYCNHPFAHLLANIFPPGHKDRDLTINQILERDYREKCLSGGDGGANSTGHGGNAGQDTRREQEEPGYVADAELADLVGVGESAASSR